MRDRNMPDDGLGRLKISASKAKLMSWTFHRPAMATDGGGFGTEKIEVELRLVDRDGALAFEATADQHFGIDPVVDSDIQSLFVRIEQALRDRTAAEARLCWEDWLEVVVTSNDHMHPKDGSVESGLDLKIRPLKKATDPETRIEYELCDGRAVRLRGPASFVDAEVENAASGVLIERPKSSSYIPDTPENRAVLEDIRARLQSLRLMLGDALSAPKIDETLDRISRVSGLIGQAAPKRLGP
jgi:hypothetical protein